MASYRDQAALEPRSRPADAHLHVSGSSQHSPNVEWLYTHASCSEAYKKDEEYFLFSFAGHVKTATASVVMDDIRAAARKGHDAG